jgi:uncharacterized lipoprotein YddW (UPF0748 family)
LRQTPASSWLLRVSFLAVGLVLACGPGETRDGAPLPDVSPRGSADRAAPPRLALWVLCEGSQRVLEHPERIARLIADARTLGATDLFVQVYRGGRAWFDSSLVDAGPYQAIRAMRGDTLAELILQAHRAGLRVHAWVNVLSLASRADATLLTELGPAAVQVDRHGRSILDYPGLDIPAPERSYYRMGTPAVWLDPAAPDVAAKLAAVFAELIERYPELDGLHLDYIRYPDVLPFSPGSRFGVGLDFGYGEASRERFRRETGLEAPFGSSLANANRWDDWRRERVTEVVRRIREATRRLHADLELSAAVWAYADRAYLAIFQDWRGWLELGLLDFTVPMAYTRDDRLLRYVTLSTTRGIAGERVWIGLGVWLFAREPERALAQWDFVRRANPAGVSLFSYDAMVEARSLWATLTGETSDGG